MLPGWFFRILLGEGTLVLRNERSPSPFNRSLFEVRRPNRGKLLESLQEPERIRIDWLG
jgi:hypothetical protein